MLRLGMGWRSRRDRPPTATHLELYEFEGCPHCRLVREAITELNLTVLIKPCPKGGQRYRSELKKRGGKEQFPYLVDHATDVEMYEAADIVKYLFTTFTDKPLPWHWQLFEFQRLGSVLASLPRLGQGMIAKKAKAPEEPLLFHGYESNPSARIVRDRLCVLQIPYELHPEALQDTPVLVDPNTNQSVHGAPDILLYLQAEYSQEVGS